MPSISSTGVGSGLDVNGIITQLMSIERRPLTLLEQQATDLKTQVSSFGKLQSLYSALRDSANKLTSLTTWGQTKAVSADDKSVGVSASSGAASGVYSVAVTNLAAGQTVTSRAFTSSASTLNAGTLTIELGTWTGDPVSGFSAKTGSTPVNISIGAGETSLTAVRDKINAAGAGVIATIINDASGARLALRSKDTGAENAFRLSATETSDDGVATDGLSALTYDAAGTSQLTLNQTAVNARATINGISIVSASNTLENVADGLTVKLLKPTTSAVELTVDTDTEAIKKDIDDFAKAFNELASFIREQTKYDAATKKAGALQGDRTAVGLQTQLRAVLNEATSASSVFTRLSDIGLVMKTDGTLETKSSKLDGALGNLTELRKMLATSGVDNASSGFMQRFKKLADLALGVEGTFETRNDSLKAMIDRNEDRQDAMKNRLEQTEKRLRAQYEALDTNMARLAGLSNYVSQQLNLLGSA